MAIVGNKIGDIGYAVQKHAENFGYGHDLYLDPANVA